jgi:hypothetical protein
MNNVATINQDQVKPLDPVAVQAVLLGGDLSLLAPAQKVSYYNKVCEVVGLNPLTKPFDYIRLNGKEVLYSNKGCSEQLRSVHKIGLKIVGKEVINDLYIVTCEALDPSGRTDSATGVVFIAGLRGEALANAMMKAETKAKRRVTLSICGLGMLDETEVESIDQTPPGAYGNGNRVIPDQPPMDECLPPENAPFKFKFGTFKYMTPKEALEKKGRADLENALDLIEAKLQKGETYKNVTTEEMKEAARQIEAVLIESERDVLSDSDESDAVGFQTFVAKGTR